MREFKVSVCGSWKENTDFQYCNSKEQLLRNTRLLKQRKSGLEISEFMAKKFLFEIVSAKHMRSHINVSKICKSSHDCRRSWKFLCVQSRESTLRNISRLNVHFTVFYVKLVYLVALTSLHSRQKKTKRMNLLYRREHRSV